MEYCCKYCGAKNSATARVDISSLGIADVLNIEGELGEINEDYPHVFDAHDIEYYVCSHCGAEENELEDLITEIPPKGGEEDELIWGQEQMD